MKQGHHTKTEPHRAERVSHRDAQVLHRSERAPHRIWVDGVRVPVRTCVVCRKRKPQRELIRIARVQNVFVPDATRKIVGRGVYVCLGQVNCMDAKNLKRLAKDGATTLAEQLARLQMTMQVLAKPDGRMN